MNALREAMRGGWRRVRALDPRHVLGLGFALFVLYGFPGYMSTDSVNQLVEARTGRYSDGNPPLMSFEWRQLDRIVSGPLLMMLLQVALFLGGLYVIVRKILAPRQAAWTSVAILMFPPVLTTMPVIWKDSQMAAFLIAGIAAILHPRLLVRLGGIGLLIIACALRHNAAAAVIPVVAILFEWCPGLPVWKRIAIVAGAGVLTLGAMFAVTRVLTVEHVRITPVYSDIVGVLSYEDDRSDAELRELMRDTPLHVTEHIQQQARLLDELRNAWRVTQGPERLFDEPANDAQWSAIVDVWKKLVLGDPLAYLEFHWEGFQRVLGSGGQAIRAPVWNNFLEDPPQMERVMHTASWSGLQHFVGYQLYWLAEHTPLFHPWIYFAIAIALLVLCCRDRITLALLTSGILYELSFFPFPAEPDYRYSHWMITTTVISAVMLFVLRRRR